MGAHGRKAFPRGCAVYVFHDRGSVLLPTTRVRWPTHLTERHAGGRSRDWSTAMNTRTPSAVAMTNATARVVDAGFPTSAVVQHRGADGSCRSTARTRRRREPTVRDRCPTPSLPIRRQRRRRADLAQPVAPGGRSQVQPGGPRPVARRNQAARAGGRPGRRWSRSRDRTSFRGRAGRLSWTRHHEWTMTRSGA